MRYAVIACSDCRLPWLVELRHSHSACRGCGRNYDLHRRKRLWGGDDIREAQQAVADLRARMSSGADPAQILADAMPERRVRHDGPVEAAAAKARGITNKSRKADAVALWLTRLLEQADHDTYIQALRRAGMDPARAEKEVIRMLAGDVIYEPKAGHYAALET